MFSIISIYVQKYNGKKIKIKANIFLFFLL